MISVRMQAIGATLCVLLQIASAASNCDRGTVEGLAKIARETCSRVETVDKYIKDVNAKKPMPEPSFTDKHGFKAILTQYNGDLGKAKSHTQPWRSGDNIKGSLKAVVLSAQGFEPKFKQEFAKTQEKVKTLVENHEDIAVVEAKVARLQAEVKNATNAAANAASPVIKAHLESVIAAKQEEINKTMEEHKVVQGRRELAELVKYLEFVKTGALAIKDESNSVSSKLSNFKAHISEDAGAFRRHQGNAQEGSAKLEAERKKNNDEIASNRKSIVDLNTKIAGENSQISSLNGQIARAQQESRDAQARIDNLLRRNKKKKRFGFIVRWVPVIGSRYYRDKKRQEENLKRQKQASINSYNGQIQNLRNNIATSQAEIKRHEARITALETRSRELDTELKHFKELNGNLQNLEKDVTGILPSIESAADSVGHIKATFDSVGQNLASAIERAKEAKTAAQVRDIRFFIYNEIEVMECKWESAKTKIVLVGNCA